MENGWAPFASASLDLGRKFEEAKRNFERVASGLVREAQRRHAAIFGDGRSTSENRVHPAVKSNEYIRSMTSSATLLRPTNTKQSPFASVSLATPVPSPSTDSTDYPETDSEDIQEDPIPEFLKKALSQAGGPPNKEDLGRASWTFLHTLAAKYPEKPTKQQQKDLKDFMYLFAKVYPCHICSLHFQEILKNNPPEVASHDAFEMYMCRVHNIVNRR